MATGKYLWQTGLLSVVLILAGGCSWLTAEYTESKDYDLTLAATGCREYAVGEDWGAVEIGSFRNLSGADRRFLFREADGRMRSDDYHRWLTVPDLTVERHLHHALADDATRLRDPGNFIRLNGTVYEFEIDLTRNAVVLTVDLAVKQYTERVLVRDEKQKFTIARPLPENRPECIVSAMSDCMQQLAEAAAAMIDAPRLGLEASATE